jgi:hypothetical protein
MKMNKKAFKISIIAVILFLIFYKRNTVRYGVITENELDNVIIDVTKTLGGGLNAALLLAETCSIESDYGNNFLTGDVGIMQFTTTGFKQVQQYTNQARKNIVKQTWNIDIDKISLIDLQYSPLKSVIFARLYYLTMPCAIPSSIAERAAYWKKYYNSVLGAGTEAQYIKKARANPRPNIIKAFS